MSGRLAAMLTMLTLAILLVGSLGFSGMRNSNDSLRTVYRIASSLKASLPKSAMGCGEPAPGFHDGSPHLKDGGPVEDAFAHIRCE